MERASVNTSVRAFLIAEARAFVSDACLLSGVTRIALIGSITTEKPEPKDVDLLVTITEDADLDPLARLGRRLQGRAQSHNRGGDVFLADPKGNYLGRTCHWKNCGPGIRLSCDALHCGQRHYLHDDWRSIRLPKNLIVAPPLELWPRQVVRVLLPEDLKRELPAFPQQEAHP
jgi:predicted nucleotidyltransferase